MNPFTTIPRLLYVFLGGAHYNKNIPTFDKLRAEGRYEEERELINKGQREFIEWLAPKLSLTFEIKGEENIPEQGPFMVYSNHQSYADIFASLWLFKDHCQIGYVAKEEWRKIGTLAKAIEYTHSIFLVRGNAREAVKSISEAKEVLDKGFNLLIFPEGTRSQRHEMGEFKAGAFKFAEKAKVPILPITLDGGYKLLEEKGTFQPAHIKITVHPLVHIEQMSKAEQKQAAIDIEETIRSAL